MRRAVNIVVFLVIIAALIGLMVVAVQRARDAAAATQCLNNLKQFGVALHAYHDVWKRLPTGTVPGTTLPPEKRLSWIPAVFPYLESNPGLRLNLKGAWDDPMNFPPWMRAGEMGGIVSEERPIGDVPLFLCAGNLERSGPSAVAPFHYPGVAGLGDNAAELPLGDAKAGFFDYDRVVRMSDLAHGAETTMALAEAIDGGPWTAGGKATVRGFPDRPPYFAADGPFSSNHRGGINVLLADGSVRVFTVDTSAHVVEAMAVLAGDRDPARFAE